MLRSNTSCLSNRMRFEPSVAYISFLTPASPSTNRERACWAKDRARSAASVGASGSHSSRSRRNRSSSPSRVSFSFLAANSASVSSPSTRRSIRASSFLSHASIVFRILSATRWRSAALSCDRLAMYSRPQTRTCSGISIDASRRSICSSIFFSPSDGCLQDGSFLRVQW